MIILISIINSISPAVPIKRNFLFLNIPVFSLFSFLFTSYTLVSASELSSFFASMTSASALFSFSFSHPSPPTVARFSENFSAPFSPAVLSCSPKAVCILSSSSSMDCIRSSLRTAIPFISTSSSAGAISAPRSEGLEIRSSCKRCRLYWGVTPVMHL